MFDDLFQANERYARSGDHDPTVAGRAGRGLALLTCMDTRLDPLAVLGLSVGDAKIVRNAGGRLTRDALRSLILATNILGATRIAVIGHTRCAMFGATEDEVRAKIRESSGSDATEWTFLTGTDQAATITTDVEQLRACPLIPAGTTVAGFVFDVDTGVLSPVEPPTEPSAS